MMSIRSLADFNGSSPGRCSDWLGTATVTARASTSGTTRRTRDGDFYLATTGDLHLATHGDFLMAMDTYAGHRRDACGLLPQRQAKGPTAAPPSLPKLATGS